MVASERPAVTTLRVVHIDTGRSWRGGQQQVFLLHRSLLDQGFGSRLLARSGGVLAARCRSTGLPVDVLKGVRPWSPVLWPALWRAVRDVDLVHAHDSHAAGLAASARRFNPRLAMVCHRRLSYPLGTGSAWRGKYRRVERWVAVSREVARVLEHSGVPRDRIRVVHSGVDLAALRLSAAVTDRAALRRELGIAERAPVVGVVASLVRQKGHAVVFSAAQRIRVEVPDVVVLCVGDGPERPRLQREVARLGLAATVRFVGFRSDVARIAGLFEVAVVASIDGEGSNAAVKEAMALGVPVVASDLGGNGEVVGSAGVLVPAGDAAALASAVAGLLRDPERRRLLAEAGRLRVERFGMDGVVRAVVKVYRELVLESCRPGESP